ncbi:MAG: hypothetical protein A2381_09495 [Bdellovibrionales bacterium RIFOXYB1_FULL_37_110]|nr:MAG: hypothetical protein A2417_03000 [Bdellovibrionales bacterium RIFOXYC1_FULL_37_79]OFZ59497.1 MAG: hypothetical protein A2381_09495 [Bdellovibrionales bacterium RIFOXYB1_FULL_37_110]OFZ64216.1 MAG: hypothetical protein A2577_12345 [Bdellovibrionales bacterium RIFOXYD1_FULL_36_51]
MADDNIVISEKDHARIMHLLGYQNSPEYENLKLELERAKLITDDQVPPNLVTMNSKVKFLNINDDKEMIVTLVYPSDADFSKGRISILAPLGSALIGLSVNQEIAWQFPNGKTKRLRILEILYQPEANCDWHL